MTRPPFKTRCRGFTMIELIMVMIVIGVLAAVGVSRFSDRASFESRGFQDETRAMLRYAQKSAVAQRRTVCVTLGATGVTLTIDKSTPADGSCDGALALPATPHGGSGLTPSVTSFNFQPLGGTDKTSDITVVIDGTTVKVDCKTGYVY